MSISVWQPHISISAVARSFRLQSTLHVILTSKTTERRGSCVNITCPANGQVFLNHFRSSNRPLFTTSGLWCQTTDFPNVLRYVNTLSCPPKVAIYPDASSFGSTANSWRDAPILTDTLSRRRSCLLISPGLMAGLTCWVLQDLLCLLNYSNRETDSRKRNHLPSLTPPNCRLSGSQLGSITANVCRTWLDREWRVNWKVPTTPHRRNCTHWFDVFKQEILCRQRQNSSADTVNILRAARVTDFCQMQVFFSSLLSADQLWPYQPNSMATWGSSTKVRAVEASSCLIISIWWRAVSPIRYSLCIHGVTINARQGWP